MKNMDQKFFERWFNGFSGGLDQLRQEECSRLFSKCALQCSCDALKYLYRDLFIECNGDLDKFFLRLNEKKILKEKLYNQEKFMNLYLQNAVALYIHKLA